ncbi:MAG: hypothetical protein AAGC64_09340 [Bacteroidota bacterium]
MKTLKIKHVLFFALVTIGFTSQGFGQSRPMDDATPEEKAEMATEKQKEKLSLDSNQEKQMYEINLKYIKEMEEIQAGGRSRSTMVKLKDMSDRRDKEVKGILGKDQYKEYTKMQEERREEMKKRMQSRRGNG